MTSSNPKALAMGSRLYVPDSPRDDQTSRSTEPVRSPMQADARWATRLMVLLLYAATYHACAIVLPARLPVLGFALWLHSLTYFGGDSSPSRWSIPMVVVFNSPELLPLLFFHVRAFFYACPLARKRGLKAGLIELSGFALCYFQAAHYPGGLAGRAWIAPLSEELIKRAAMRVMPGGDILLPIWEAWLHLTVTGSSQIPVRVLGFAFHHVTARMPMWFGILLHWLWNMTAKEMILTTPVTEALHQPQLSFSLHEGILLAVGGCASLAQVGFHVLGHAALMTILVGAAVVPVVFGNLLILALAAARWAARVKGPSKWCRIVWHLIWFGGEGFLTLEDFLRHFSMLYAHQEDHDVLRREFSTMAAPVITKKERLDHPHGNAAYLRTCFIEGAVRLAHLMGRKPFFYQMSQSNVRDGHAGSRVMYWSKDLAGTPTLDLPTQDALLILVDVEYHMDNFSSWLASFGLPTLIYTCCPTLAAAACVNNAAWTFLDDGRIKVTVSGSAEGYTHQLWNYETDTLWVEGPRGAVHYLCEKRQVDSLKAAVLLAPVAKFGMVGAKLASRLLSRTPLRRFNPVDVTESGRAFAAFNVLTRGEHRVTVAACGSYDCADVTQTEFSRAVAGAQASSTAPNISTVATWINKPDLLETRGASAHIVNYLRAKPMTLRVDTTSVPLTRYVYSFAVSTAGDAKSKPCIGQFMSPLDPNVYVPTTDPENTRAGVVHRVLIPSSQCEVNPPHSRFYRYGREYAMMVVAACEATRGLIPLEYDEVLARQSSGSKASKVKSYLEVGANSKLTSAFYKSEPKKSAGPPRVITQFDAGTKTEYARYILALADELKKLSSYGFKRPADIAEALVGITINPSVTAVIETDYTLFDAHISEILRDIHDLPLMSAFFPREAGRLLQLYRFHVNQNVKVFGDDFGVGKFDYNSGHTTCSGGMDTSAFNTSRNSFVQYATFRELGHEPGAAFTLTCTRTLAGGDDGVAGVEDPLRYVKQLENVCRTFGLKIKAKVVQRGHPYTFLSRYWNTWWGDENSMCVPSRAIRNLSVSAGPGEPLVKLKEKCSGYAVTDGNTPVIGIWARTAVRFTEATATDATNWWVATYGETNYPNKYQQWFSEIFLVDYPEFDVGKFDAWITTVDCAKAMLESAPQCVPLRAPVVESEPIAVVDGDLVAGSQNDAVSAASVSVGRKADGGPALKPTRSDRRAPSASSEAAAPRGRNPPGQVPGRVARGDRNIPVRPPKLTRADHGAGLGENKQPEPEGS